MSQSVYTATYMLHHRANSVRNVLVHKRQSHSRQAHTGSQATRQLKCQDRYSLEPQPLRPPRLLTVTPCYSKRAHFPGFPIFDNDVEVPLENYWIQIVKMTTVVKLTPENPPQDVELTTGGEQSQSQRAELQSPSDNNHEQPEMASLFRKFWCAATDDSRLTLFGFRRFRTSHLLNLRYLEEEIHKVDHDIFQAGLQLGVPCTAADRLGLKHGRRDNRALGVEALITPELISRLRDLLKQYGSYAHAINPLVLFLTSNCLLRRNFDCF